MKGGTAKATVLEQFVAVTAADVAVVCRAVPATKSVPKRSYGELEAARAAFGVAESKTPILTACPAAYASGNKLHFQAAIAAEAMETEPHKWVRHISQAFFKAFAVSFMEG